MIKSGIPLIVLFYKMLERDYSSSNSSHSQSTHTQTITTPIIISMVLLCCGQLLIYIHEVEFNWLCFITSLCALFASGTKLLVIEKLLKHKKSISSSISSPRSPSPTYNAKDIQNEGESSKLNVREEIDEDEENEDTTATFIGMDSFSPAELMITDDDEAPLFYDVDIDTIDDKHINTMNTNDRYREHVELQLVKTNKAEKVKHISSGNENVNGHELTSSHGHDPPHKNGVIQNGKSSTKKDLNFFKKILDKLNTMNLESDDDENDNDLGMEIIKEEKKKVSNFMEDIPLNEDQKLENERKFNQSISSKRRNKKQKIHSILALFYFMPISWFTAMVAWTIFEYPQTQNDKAFNDTSLLIPILFQYLLSAVIAIALNWCELFMIGHWNALSFCIFSVFKLILIVGASWLVFGHSFTFMSFSGYLLCILGVLCYNWSQIKDKKKVKKDMKRISKALCKCMNKIECFKRNRRYLYSKIFNEPSYDPNDERSPIYDDYSDTTSDDGYYG